MTRERKEMLNQQKSFGYVILQILRIFHTLDPEPVGLAKWREILLSLIQNQNTPLLQENVLPQVKYLMFFLGIYFPSISDNGINILRTFQTRR